MKTEYPDDGAGRDCACSAEGERHKNSQAKVPAPDETPKTGVKAGPKKQPAHSGESFR